MKKLLALILCVMMFVAVIPTSAFAHTYGDPKVDNPLYSAAEYATQIKNMIKNTKSSIEKSYKVLAGDQVVYGSAKAMDDMIVGLVDGIGDTLIEKELMKKADVDGIKDNVRSYIDGAVAKKISENYYKALDKDGKRDPIKYAQLVADSIQGALTDEDFQKGYEAVATYWALASLIKDTRDSLKDARKDFSDSVDKKFQADFAKKYTALVDEYIDTFGTAANKALNNEMAQLALDSLMLPVETNKATSTDLATKTYNAAIKQLAKEKKIDVNAAEDVLAAADLEFAKAELEYKKAVAEGKGTPSAEALEKYVNAVQTHAEAKQTYADRIAYLDKAYAKAEDAAKDEFDLKMLEIGYNYDIGSLEAAADWADAGYEFKTINPWGDVNYYTFPNVGSWN